jgi:nucleotide-binding universal stress UspA family protein
MIPIATILVDVDALAGGHPALEQAAALAERCGSRLKVVDVLPWVPAGARHFVTADLEQELIEHRRERLNAIAKGVQRVEISSELLRGRPATALIQEVLRSGHDLLVRSHGRDVTAGPRPFGATDMELLRHCPCPVWLIGPGAPHRPWRILAAIHSDPADPTEQALNGTTLEWALTLKAFGDAQLTLLQAWTPFAAKVLRSRMPPEEFAAMVEAGRDAENKALTELLTPFGPRLTDVAVELVDGEPEDAIARYVETHGIDVVVMGTVARTGIAGLVMGNTAERVLQRLRGSVLAVKPPGFHTPVADVGRRH